MKNQSIFGLIELGLTEKEARLYKAALKVGPATAQVLSLESGLKRATVYSCVDSLIEKGLLHIEINGVRKLFIAATPDKLVSLLEHKKQILKDIMPELMQDYTQASDSANKIKIYHGIAGIKLIYDQILLTVKPHEEYLVISNQEKWYALDPSYFEAFIKKRATFNLITKLILQDNEHARIYQAEETQYREKIKLLSKNLDLNINLVIFSQKVLIVQIAEPLLAILIENQNVAAMITVLFNTIWDLL